MEIPVTQAIRDMNLMPKHMVADGFLTPEVHAELIAHTIENEDKFVPSVVAANDRHGYDPNIRLAWYCQEGLGAVKAPFKAALAARMDEILPAIGMKPFEIAKWELELVAHRDGSYFSPHMDTLTQNHRQFAESDRIVTMVYYFHLQPRRFSGGELALYPFGKAAPVEIDPQDNRLLAFPSISLHEVRPVRAPADFAGARFAINCWLHRARAG